ncbi:MAG: ankyrin repeat domain-containing protein [Spirochaetales bacterium]|nr:ankyrin repeat domain-containing protein [Spirochaetales bacterium]
MRRIGLSLFFTGLCLLSWNLNAATISIDDLINSIVAGDYDKAGDLVSKGVDVNGRDRDGFSPMMCAVGNNDPAMMKMLLLKGASINERYENGNTLLVYAAKKAGGEVIRILLEAGADLKAVNSRGKNAQIIACEKGNADGLDALLEKGADARTLDGYRNTLLMISIKNSRRKCTELILGGNPQVNHLNVSGESALSLACEKNDPVLVRNLIDAGADLYLRHNGRKYRGKSILPIVRAMGNRPEIEELLSGLVDPSRLLPGPGDTERNVQLVSAVESNAFRDVENLVNRGADPGGTEEGSEGLLLKALNNGNERMAELLWEVSPLTGEEIRRKNELVEAAINIRSHRFAFRFMDYADDSKTVLLRSIEYGWYDCVKALLGKRVDPDFESSEAVTPLILACSRGDVKTVSLLRKYGVSLNRETSGGQTAIGRAIENHDKLMMEYLLDYGAHPDAESPSGRSALYEAASQGWADLAGRLLERSVNPDADCRAGGALMAAIGNGYYGIAAKLLKAGADPSRASGSEGKTPLMEASSLGCLSIVDLLLKSGAEVNTLDAHGNNALNYSFHASSSLKKRIAVLLIDRGAGINVGEKLPGGREGTTPLMHAAASGWDDVLSTLLDKGAEVDARDRYSGTALFYAARYGRLKCVKILLSHNADPVVESAVGGTPLIAALENGQTEVPEYLLSLKKYRVDVLQGRNSALVISAGKGLSDIVDTLLLKGVPADEKDAFGFTPVLKASANGQTFIVKLLLKKGANPRVLGPVGNTALMLAASGGYTETAAYLIEKGLKVNASNDEGDTPLILASFNCYLETGRLLLSKGADLEKLNSSGESCLSRALAKVANEDPVKREEYLKWLLINGAPVTPLLKVKDGRQKILLEIAANPGTEIFKHTGEPDYLRFCLDMGADPDAADRDGKIPLDWALSINNRDSVRILLAYGAFPGKLNNAAPAMKDLVPVDKQGLVESAALYGGRKRLKALAKTGLNLNRKNVKGETPFFLSVKNGNQDAAEYLLSLKPDVNITDSSGHTAVFYAVKNNWTYFIQELLDRGAGIDGKTDPEASPLFSAFKAGNRRICEMLVEHAGNKMAGKDEENQDILMLSLLNGWPELSASLAVKTMDLDNRDKHGNTPLFYAAEKGFDEVVKTLLFRKADPSVSNNNRATPLMAAAGAGRDMTVRLLLSAGADVNAADGDGKTALGYAIASGSCETVMALIENGAHVTPPGEKVYPLYNYLAGRFADTPDYCEIFTLLAAKEAAADTRDEYGNTPLILASKKGALKLIKLLIQEGAAVNEVDALRVSSLMYASETGKKDSVRELVNNGARINSQSGEGSTALGYAIRYRYRNSPVRFYDGIIRFLLERNADPLLSEDSGQSAMSMAAGAGYMGLLLDMKDRAAVLRRDPDFRRALLEGSLNGKKDVTANLAETYFPVEHLTDSDVPLLNVYLDSCRNFDKGIFAELLSTGVDLDAKDASGRTAMMVASKRGFAYAVEILIKNGADMDERDGISAWTALIYAAINKQKACMRVLIDANAEGVELTEKGYIIRYTDRYGKGEMEFISKEKLYED